MGTKNAPGQFDCYANAEPDEPMFVLLARDPVAPRLVRWWCAERLKLIKAGLKPESDTEMISEAIDCADAMAAWRADHRAPIELEPARDRIAELLAANNAEVERRRAAEAERDRLRALIDAPEIVDFIKAVRIEMPHQRERWGVAHDAGKTDADWLWLIGWLAGKALHNPLKEGMSEVEAKLHRIVTIAAAAGNWHAQVLGASNVMRPGIAPPAGEDAA